MNTPNPSRGPILYLCFGALVLGAVRLVCFALDLGGAAALWFCLITALLFLVFSAAAWYLGLLGRQRSLLLQERRLAELEGELEQLPPLRAELQSLRQARAAETDSLTGLMSYGRFQALLAAGLPEAQRLGQLVGIILVDIDTFSRFNRTLGHGAGDEVLRETALRLQKALGSSAGISRLGGDVFTCVVPGQKNLEDLNRTAGKAADVFRDPFQIHFREFFATASIGYAVFPHDGTDAPSLLKHADSALFQAKKDGGDRIQAYRPVMTDQARERLALETGLRKALERDELVLHFQPQIDVAGGRLLGCEALVRWNHPQLGMVSPAQFIPLAEQTGLILPMGEWVLRKACRCWSNWGKAGMDPRRLSVNLSPRQLREPGLARSVALILEETGMDPAFLELEVTESALMENLDQAVRTLGVFRELGIRISIDDFGTGYSSLGTLASLPIDLLKIDRTFIRNLPDDKSAAAIIQTILAMAGSLRLQVIAEGVETVPQRDFLLWFQCYWMQGYLFSPPVPEPKYVSMLLGKEAGLFPLQQPDASAVWSAASP